MTLVCVPILVQSVESALADAADAKAGGADLVEYRVDGFAEGEGEFDDVVRLASESPLPCIVTCRRADEGGQGGLDESLRVSLYERLGTAFGPGERPPRYLDVELASFEASANIRQKIRLAIQHPEQLRDLQTSLILSMHDFKGRPDDLARRVSRLASEPAAGVIKIAYRARSLRDSLEILELPRLTGRPTIALGMGEFGLMSRVLAPKFGAFLTFAALRPAGATAPGQPTLSELLGRYRFRAIGPSTKVYGVVGWPVAHSLSPVIHNAGFAAAGLDSVYLPLPVAADSDPETSYLSFKATMLELIEHPGLTFAGASVTMPHKANLVRLARERGWSLDEISSHTGAANTLVMGQGTGTPRAAVLNTDAPAIVGAILKKIPALQGRLVAVLGAGGTARAAAAGLLQAGADVLVCARSPDQAESLAADSAPLARHGATIRPADLATLGGSLDAGARSPDAVVNCTPLGMKVQDAKGGPDASPLTREMVQRLAEASKGRAVVVELVYRPHQTPLVQFATDAGLQGGLVGGLEILCAQAERQFEAWTGAAPAPGLFMQAATGLERSPRAEDRALWAGDA